MKAIEIYNAIQGLNPKSSVVSSAGEYTSNVDQQISDDLRGSLLQYLPEGTLARKIANDSNKFTEKQLWVIAFELIKNAEYCEKLAAETSATRKQIAFEKARKRAKNAARKARDQEIMNFKAENNARNNALHGNVRHPMHGEGVVVSIDDETITINFQNAGEIRLVKAYAKLEQL
jgi:hypothetical protein